MVKLTGQFLRQNFKYWKRYVWREMHKEHYRALTLRPLVGWKEIPKHHWNFDEHQPWTKEFQMNNKPWSKKQRLWFEPVKDWMIFKGDRVEILVGPDKGKVGIVSFVVKERNWVFVEGLNCEYKMQQVQQNLPPLCIKKELPLLYNKQVRLVDPGDNLAADVEWRYTEKGERVRVSLRSGRIIPKPVMANQLEDYVYPEGFVETNKDTKEDDIIKVTFEPKLKTFEEDIKDSMGIQDDRKPKKTYWY